MENTIYKKGVHYVVATITVVMLSFFAQIQAATVFLDDFEDGDHIGWNVTAGGGSNGIEFVNESNWAFGHNNRSGKHSLSREFDYQPNSVLSFDMQALASTGATNFRQTTHAAGGITISFENRFNVTLGDVSFVFATSDSLLPSNAFKIDNTPDSFEAQMFEWADLALVDPASDISDISLEFWARGHTAQIPQGRAASAHIRFDNVIISPVPIPGAVWLFVSALASFGFISRKAWK